MNTIPPEVIAFVSLIIVAAAGALATYVVTHAKTIIPDVITTLKTDLGPAKWDTLMSMARIAIKAADQAQLNKWIDQTGEAAKKYDLNAVKAFLKAQGLEGIDVDALDALIEGVYNDIKAELQKDLPELDTSTTPVLPVTGVTTTR
jgi:hypothetical protein